MSFYWMNSMRGLLWFSENLSFFSDGSEGEVLSPKQSLERSGLWMLDCWIQGETSQVQGEGDVLKVEPTRFPLGFNVGCGLRNGKVGAARDCCRKGGRAVG